MRHITNEITLFHLKKLFCDMMKIFLFLLFMLFCSVFTAPAADNLPDVSGDCNWDFQEVDWNYDRTGSHTGFKLLDLNI